MPDGNTPVAVVSKANLKNVLRGATVTAASWGTAPTNLSNATDGNPNTATGAGTTTTTGAGLIGYIWVDRGAGNTDPIMIDLDLLYSSASGSVKCFIDTSTDGTTPISAGNQTIMEPQISTTPVGAVITPKTIKTRYFRLFFYASAAAKCDITINEIKGYKMLG